MSRRYNPPPTYADPIKQEGGRWVFDPLWLKWFVDLALHIRGFTANSFVVTTDTVSTVIPTASATTVFTFPIGEPAAYLVHLSAAGATAATNYAAFYIVLTAGSTARLAFASGAVNLTAVLSGMDLHVTQTSGADLRINADITEVG